MNIAIKQEKQLEDDKILKIVNRVLTQIFGEEATQLIYKHLENHHKLERHQIAERIDVFAKGLEEFLKSGASVIEQRILEDVYSSYGLLRRLELERIQERQDFVGQIRLLVRKA